MSRAEDDAREAARLRSAIEDRLRREERGWRRVRSWSTPARRGIALALVAALALGVFLLMPRSDLAAYPIARLWIGIGLLGTASTLLVWALFHPLHRRPIRPARIAGALAAALILPVALSIVPAAHEAMHTHPESFQGTGADFWPRALQCLLFGTIVGLPIALFVSLADRRPTAGPSRIWLAAAAGGLAGVLALLLHCPIVVIAHRAGGHAAVPFALALILFLVARANRRRIRRHR